MFRTDGNPARSRIVLVVGVDLSDISEHLLETTRNLTRSVDHAELHVVHVVHPESLSKRLVEPTGAAALEEQCRAEDAKWELARLCDSTVLGSRATCTIHTPVGHTAEELARVARDVGADVIVVEAHDGVRRRHLFQRGVVARIAATAPCSVLTVRPRPKPEPRRACAVPAERAEFSWTH